MKGLMILMVATLLSLYSSAQQNRDSLSNERKKRFQKWVSIKDSLLSDSLFNSYSDFRADTTGKLGFRIKYFEAHNIPFEGLSKQRILEFLGKPNSIDSIKYKGDSLQTIKFKYYMGSVSDSVTDEQRRNGRVGSGKSYSLTINIKNNRAVYAPLSYNTSIWSAVW